MNINRCVLLLVAVLCFGRVDAATVSVSLAELDEALIAARNQPDAVQRLVLDKIQQRFAEAESGFKDGTIIYQDDIVDELVEEGCNRTRIIRMHNEIKVRENTSIAFDFESLFDPLVITLELYSTVSASGRAQQVFGFRFGSCQDIVSNSFNFSAIGPVNLKLTMSITLNSEWLDATTLRVRPKIELQGELLESNIVVDVDDSLLRSLLEGYLQDEVDELFVPERIQQEIADLQTQLDTQIQDALQGDGNSGYLDVELPPADDDQIITLYELLTPQARFPLTADFIESHRVELIAALVLDDREAVTEILENSAVCEVSGTLRVGLQKTQWYDMASGVCEPVAALTAGTLYSDNTCTQPFDTINSSYTDFCQVVLDSDRLGNPQSRSHELDRWSYSPGTTFDIGVLSIVGKTQPLVKRTRYKTVATSGGECQLEMRIYSPDPHVQNRKPLIAIHGGSWQHRGTGFLGIENMATHFVDAGFVVFSPFYRLIGDSEGGAACNQAAIADLRADAEDALNWVKNNQQAYGAVGKPVVFGQSSGGHLAASLAVTRAQDIERAVLFYSPTDFRDFAEQIQSAAYTGEQGRSILEAVTGSSVDLLELDGALVASNSFPTPVSADPSAYPPMFLLHGESDSLLSFRQSVRMCNGLAGDLANGPAVLSANTSSLSRVISCGMLGSQLHLIAQGEHTLDLCLTDELCLAGLPASAAKTAESIQSMLDWSAAENATDVGPANIASSASTGGSGSMGLGLGLLFFVNWLINVRRAIGRCSAIEDGKSADPRVAVISCGDRLTKGSNVGFKPV